MDLVGSTRLEEAKTTILAVILIRSRSTWTHLTKRNVVVGGSHAVLVDGVLRAMLQEISDLGYFADVEKAFTVCDVQIREMQRSMMRR